MFFRDIQPDLPANHPMSYIFQSLATELDMLEHEKWKESNYAEGEEYFNAKRKYTTWKHETLNTLSALSSLIEQTNRIF